MQFVALKIISNSKHYEPFEHLSSVVRRPNALKTHLRTGQFGGGLRNIIQCEVNRSVQLTEIVTITSPDYLKNSILSVVE